MSSQRPSRLRIMWVLPPIIVGILVMMFMQSGKQAPVKSERGEPTRAVRVITVPSVALSPRAEGWGTVQPAQIWTAVAQVSGRITEMHPKLRNGESISADTLLFRIDPVDYELKLAQAQAELAELDIQEQNTNASLEIEQRNQAVAKRELNRISKLVKKGTTSQSDADTAERTLLQVRTSVQNQQNTLALIPVKRRLLDAKVRQAERDLANTEVKAPFNLRVANLKIERDQYVSKGQSLFEGDSVDRVEVVAQVAMSSLRPLFLGRPDSIRNIEQMNRDLPGFTGFRPTLNLDMGNHDAQWEAEFVRFSDSIDSETRTIGVVVAVEDPLSLVRPGLRPPLSKGMFVQVSIAGHTQADRIVLPRSAIHDSKVYLVDAEQRLRTQPVKVLFSQGSLSVIEEGVEAGQTVVVSDLVPAVDGMLLQTSTDDQMQAEIEANAKGTI